jgi:thioredoxin-related protein|tara:strand:- start:617 stop:1045 length:429 start_codon:yes stop_codon:yes gene_type:complete
MKKLFFGIILLSSMMIFSQNWETSYESSITKAQAQNKKIILVFQGSDWCGPCIKLSKEIWSSQEFIDYSKENYILIQADFPRKKKNALKIEQQEINNFLAEKYNPNGYFPLVVILNKDGQVIGETSYKKTSPKKYINLLESF